MEVTIQPVFKTATGYEASKDPMADTLARRRPDAWEVYDQTGTMRGRFDTIRRAWKAADRIS
jgi:hypothetical protein